MTDDVEQPKPKRSIRMRADRIKPFRCKHLIAVLEDPQNIRNLATVIRNVNALGVEKVYVVDPGRLLSDNWHELRARASLAKISVSAAKWTFVKRYDSTADCLDYLEHKGFVSIVTSPHVKGKTNMLFDAVDYAQFAKLAIWFGTESRGISDDAVERSAMCVSIPMFGMIESLNLGTSSGIILYEVAKQRRAYQSLYAKKDRKGVRPTPLPTVIDPPNA